MNSGLVEARELAARISQILRGEGPSSLLDEFATERTTVAMAPRRRLSARAFGTAVGDPWVRQNAARILACIPASGDDLEPLLKQIGLTAAP